MNRARNFPPSPSFAAIAVALATQIADLECFTGSDEETSPLVDAFSTTEKALTRRPIECIGDLLLKIEILSRIAEHSSVDPEEWQALARDVEQLNGPGMAFAPEAWLRRWTAKGGGYVRTDTGLSFVAPEPPTFQQRLLLDELQRAQGHQAVADVIDGKSEPVAPTWETARAAFDAKAAEIAQIEASDTHLDEYWDAWDTAMLCPSDSIDAANWKMAQFFHWTDECGEFADEAAEKYRDAIFADVARHARKGGAA
ncbi:MAG TPA: hypothetical protein VN034_06540 [Sphingopyxis sp.]|nr:hypothetical protein [Sphingopyxis sp.]